jgi:hypothetical protein
MECGALAEFTFKPDFPTLHFHQAAGDIQAQTGTGHFARFWIFRPEEFLKNLTLVVLVYADPFISNPVVNDSRCAAWIPHVVC